MSSAYETYVFLNSIPVSVLNVYLIYLLMFKSKLITGTYKWLLIIFVICNATHNLMDVVGTVNSHVAKQAFLIYLTGWLGQWRISTSIVLLYVYTTTTTHLALECLHFALRYVILCRPNRPWLREDQFWKVILFATILLCILTVLTYVTLSADTELCTFLQNEFSKVYEGPLFCENSIGVMYYHLDEKGKPVLHWRGISGVFILFAFYMVSLYVIFTCYMGIRAALHTPALSIHTKRLQSKLFTVLIAQTIPAVLLYVPLLCLAFFPLLGISLGRYSNIIIICFMTYHLIEPMVFLYFVPEFRKTSIDLVLFRRRSLGVASLVHTNTR